MEQPSPLTDLGAAVADAADLLDSVGEDQWDRPSPCAGWSARDVADHLVAGQLLFAEALGGAPRAGGPATGEVTTAYRDSSATMLEAFRAPGALERLVTLPVGTVPGSVALRLRVVEALVHGWDVARATDQPPRADEAVAERALGFTRAMLPGLPDGHRPFAPEVAVAGDRPALDRLVALLGREVAGP